MTHPILHFLIPVITLLLLRFDKKLVLLLSPLALIPDFDYFIPPHRGLGHSLLFGALIISILYLALKDRYRKNDLLIIAIVMFSSHLILDGDVAWLYPLSDRRFGYDYGLHKFIWDDHVTEPRHYFSQHYEILNMIGIIISAGLLFFFWPSRARSRARHS